MRDLHPDDPTVKAAAFAVQIEDFWRSPIGGYLIGRCNEEIQTQTAQLVEHAHEFSKEAIRDCQTAIWRASKFNQWLSEAYADGQTALKALEGEDHESD